MNTIIRYIFLSAVQCFTPLLAQAELSTSQFEASHSKGPSEGGAALMRGSMSWTDDGTSGRAGFGYMATPSDRDLGEEYNDSSKVLARIKRLEKSEFWFEYITLTGEVVKLGCMGGQAWKTGGPLGVFRSIPPRKRVSSFSQRGTSL